MVGLKVEGLKLKEEGRFAGIVASCIDPLDRLRFKACNKLGGEGR